MWSFRALARLVDTKGHDARYVAAAIGRAGGTAVTVDVGTLADPPVRPEVARETVAECHRKGRAFVQGCSGRGPSPGFTGRRPLGDRGCWRV